MSRSYTILNPYTGKFTVLRDPHHSTMYIMECLINQPNLKLVKWFVRFRYEETPHNSKLYLMNEIVNKENPTIRDLAKLVEMLHKYAFDRSKHKEEKDEKNKDKSE